ncbi:MAG: hypothetical protein IJI78_00945 [Oscillospiraceae bacterium]|nr:hypothetical protein [Oscillospiraceae bacterium]
MSQERKHYTALMAFTTPANQVWRLLNNFGNKQLYGNNMHANLAPDESGGWSGTFVIGSTSFRAVYRPYDIRLTSPELKIGLSLQPQKEGCIAMTVATHGENAPFIVTEYELLQFLSSLKSCAGEIIKDSDILIADTTKRNASSAQTSSAGTSSHSRPALLNKRDPQATQSFAKPVVPDSSSAKKTSKTTAAKEPQTKKSSSASSQRPDVSKDSSSETRRKAAQERRRASQERDVRELYKSDEASKRKAKRRSKIAKGIVLVLIAAIAVLAVLWGIKTVKKLFPSSEATDPSTNAHGSKGVSFSNGINLSPGITRSQIERTFGKPVSQSNGVSRYESYSLTSYGTPTCVVQVEYTGQIADKITVLDLEEASRIGAISNFEPSYNAETSLSELCEQIGTTPSMVRIYADEGRQVTEYHFGHVDPKANLSPSWKGELVCSQLSDGTYQTSYGVNFDGQDPLYMSSLEGSKLANIYSSFNDYLDDYYEFHKCLLMQNHYSRGDMKQIVSGMERVSAGETEVYRANSSCMLADGVTPAWNYTIGIGARGTFMYFFGVNTRNWRKADLLKDVDIKSIDVGMNWNDLLASVGQIPNMVYVDYSYITLGFGAYKEDAQYMSEQFELMTVIDLETWTIETVYDNTDRVIVIE